MICQIKNIVALVLEGSKTHALHISICVLQTSYIIPQTPQVFPSKLASRGRIICKTTLRYLWLIRDYLPDKCSFAHLFPRCISFDNHHPCAFPWHLRLQFVKWNRSGTGRVVLLCKRCIATQEKLRYTWDVETELESTMRRVYTSLAGFWRK